MTDNAPHPGWWLASDGRYYPPELHTDETYRSAWSSTTNPAANSASAGSPGSSGAPSGFDLPVPSSVSSVADLYPSAPPSMGTPVSPQSLPAPTATLGATAPPIAAKQAPPANWPAGRTEHVEEPFDRNRVVAIGLFALAAVAITGAFLPWVSVSGETIEGSLTGWQRNDGKATVAIAVVLAGIAGMLFVGWKSALVKVALVASGLALAVIAIVDGFNVISEGNELDTSTFDIDFSIGLGSWVTVAVGALLALLSLVERSSWTKL